MSWELTGNAGTNPATNFLGTTDNEPLIIKTNGAEQLHIDVAGNVGIGQPAPRVKLDIVASGTYSNIEFTGHPVEISTGTTSSDYTLFIGADKANHLSYIQSANINTAKTTLALNPQGGNVGIGTASPSARLSVVASGVPEIIGTARSATLLSSADILGASINSEQALASFGLLVDGENSVSLGVRAVRTSAGAGWPTTAIGLGMDVDNTVRAGASLFLHANGNVGIGISRPDATLTVAGLIHNTAGGIKFPDGSTQITATLRGPQGPQGQQGPPGPAVHTSAVCGPNACAQACNNRIVASQSGACAITSETGQCTAPAGEWCCVCAP